jgi:hypothetical protein
MPALTVRVRSYNTFLGPKLGFGTETRNWISSARIVCNCESGYTLFINFQTAENPGPLPFSRRLDHGYNINIFVPYDQYPNYIDLLRNESPRIGTNMDRSSGILSTYYW